MTDQPVQPEAPTTKAGRVLLEQEAYNSRSFPLITVEAILAIEAEARAASQPLSQERPPIDVVRLAKAMALVYVTGHPIHEAVEHWESYRTDATELIAAYGAAEELDD
jgi:hypothetical protein